MLNWAPTGVFVYPLENNIWLPLFLLPLEAPDAAMIYCFDICLLIELIERLLFLALPISVVGATPWVEICPLSV